MAKKYNYNRRSRNIGNSYRNRKSARKNFARKNRASELTNLAYKMGLVKRGLNNPDSKISAAYERGVTVPEKREKKTLF